MLDKSFFHVGIVVPRLEEALEHLTKALGVRWCAVTEVEMAVEDGAGRPATVPLRMVYSAEPPYVEVIQEVAGTPWVCNPHSNLHHIGFWAEGLQATHDHLVASACPLEVAGAGDGRGPQSFTYHRDPLGVRVELVDAAMRPVIEASIEAGAALGQA
jgi:catechol 2,3-dioxygenase-like lactoylglutathione lyase family enzyme